MIDAMEMNKVKSLMMHTHLKQQYFLLILIVHAYAL